MFWGVIRRVYGRPLYLAVAATTATLTLSVLLLFPNRALVFEVMLLAETGVLSKLLFLINLHGVLFTNFTLLSATSTVIVAVLFGINVSLLWYYVARARRISRSDRTLTLTGVGGFISGLFGIGCAACGTIVLSGFLKLLGIAWLVAYLPLHGAEFGLVAIVLLGVTTYLLIRRINDPLLCSAV